MCFDMRMDRTALYASENNFQVFTTTNATSRWKDINQVILPRQAGKRDNLGLLRPSRFIVAAVPPMGKTPLSFSPIVSYAPSPSSEPGSRGGLPGP